MPRRARALRRHAGDVPAVEQHLPWSGRRKPDSSPNSVVLPAPLGPTSALMLPAGTARLTSCTAFRPPKLMDSAQLAAACHFSSAARGPLEQPRRRLAAAADAARREGHDQDQHHAVDHHADAGQLAEQVARQVGQRVQRQRAQHRSPQRAHAADDGAHQRLDRHGRAEGDGRVDVLKHLHIEGAGRAHEGRRQRDAAQLHAQRIDAARAAPRCRARPADRRRSASGAARP